ncbi:MAG: hypothetical protein BGN88_12365 [Clostridiales bacterium 43-6]|nr:MAG: hypothetical protein BGN88_12365 [Clostridiales bacterium 43-6]
MNWNAVTASTISGALFNSFGAGLGQSQANFYGNSKLISAVSGGFFNVSGAVNDVAGSIVFATMGKQTKDAVLGLTPNPYKLSAIDVLRLKKLEVGIQ